jgi:sec-independent protein translocase protein TatB
MFPEGRALEFLLAAVVALVVVGPKDLPMLMRKLGQFVGRMRAMAAEFRASFDEMARQSELDDLRKEVEAMRQAQFADVAEKAGAADIHEAFDGIRQDLAGLGADVHAPGAPFNPSDFSPASEAAPAIPADEPKPKPKPKARRKPPAAAAKSSATPRQAPARPRAKKKPEAGA